MAALPAPAHVAHFPAEVRNVLVVVNGLQDCHAIAAKLAAMHQRESLRIYLLAVEHAPSGHAMAFLRNIDVKRLLREDGLAALRPLRDLLDRAGLPYRHDVEVGPWEETIARFAQDRCCRTLVMGDRDSARFAHLLLRHDAWRIRTRLGRAGFTCETV